MLWDNKNHLFFATPVLQEFEILNSLFQQTKPIPTNCTNKYSYIRRVFRTDCMMPIEKKDQVDFSVNFLTTCKFLQQSNSAEVHLEIKKCQRKVYVYARRSFQSSYM
jgi:hypothetical protein